MPRQTKEGRSSTDLCRRSWRWRNQRTPPLGEGDDDEALTTNPPLGEMDRGYLIRHHRRPVVSPYPSLNQGMRSVEGIGTYLVRFIVLLPHRP
jgi:hypothetical protein